MGSPRLEEVHLAKSSTKGPLLEEVHLAKSSTRDGGGSHRGGCHEDLSRHPEQSVRPRKMWVKNVKMLKYDKKRQLLIVLKKAARKDMCDTKYLLVSCKMLMKKGIEIDQFIILTCLYWICLD